MKINLHDLLVLMDTSYHATSIIGLGTIGCKYNEQQILGALNRVNESIAEIELNVQKVEGKHD